MAKTQPKIEDIKGLTQWINFLWLKLKDLFSAESETTNDNYLPKIDDVNKKLVKSNIQDDGTTPKYGDNTIWHSGNDGSTSGLDADLLDGNHASDFATSTQGEKADTALQEITKEMVEAVLTEVITSHEHNYATSTDVQTAVASVFKLKGNIADKTALLDLINVKQGDVYNVQADFILDNGQRVKAGDNIVCLSDAPTSEEENWDNLCGNETNRTIKVDGIDKAGSLTTTPLNFKSTDDISVYGSSSGFGLDISFSSNSLLFRGELSEALSPEPASFQSGNLLNGIYDIDSDTTYYDVPNVSCGTDTNKSGMKGSLVSQLNGYGKSLVYHCFITNNIYICSGTIIDDGTGNINWSNWKRLLTCEDNNEIPDDLEGAGYLYQINSSYQRIILNSRDIKDEIVKIDLKLFNSQIGAKIRIIIEFNSVSTNPNINIIDSTNPTKTINYSASYYTVPTSVANVYRVEYEIFNLSTYWLVSNKIY